MLYLHLMKCTQEFVGKTISLARQDKIKPWWTDHKLYGLKLWRWTVYRMAKDFFWLTDIIVFRKNLIWFFCSYQWWLFFHFKLFNLLARLQNTRQQKLTEKTTFTFPQSCDLHTNKFWHRLRECGTKRALVVHPLNIHFSEIAGVWDCKSTHFTHLDLITEHDCQVFCKSSYLFNKIELFTMYFTFLSTLLEEEWDMLKFEAGLPEEKTKNVYFVKKNSWSFPCFEMTNAWW